MPKKHERVGLWMVGACGAVGSTVAMGLAALRKGLAASTGLVTELGPLATAGLVAPASFVVGGHEIRPVSLLDTVRALRDRSGLFQPELIRACTPWLRTTQRNIQPGTLCGSPSTARKPVDGATCPHDKSAAAAIERLAADITAFRRTHKLDRVVVIHVASCESKARRHAAHADDRKLQRALGRTASSVLPTSSLYALAAIEAECAYVNFTPSTGICLPALRERATKRGIPFMGNDGKTGETLVKSVLAPLFAMRNLSVLSWTGQNILGNRDGKTLTDPKIRAAKIQSKDKVASRILGPKTATHVSIDYVESLDDWKVAWDYIHFEGFLGTKMSMQFTWQASDSILAAPLVIDLARLASAELAAGRGGVMAHLAFFFKDPIDAVEHDLFSQWQRLIAHVAPNAGPER